MTHKDSRVLVTGSSKGIGADIAAAFAREGAQLVLSGRDESALEHQASELAETFGVRTSVAVVDLAADDGPDALADAALAAFGGLDVLVNNAGISYPEFVDGVTAANFDAVMTVNLRAPALLAARIGTAMADAGGGSIVTIASAAGIRALPEHFAYSTSKAGIIMATRVIALELGSRGVRANSVCPGIVLTDMGTKVWGDQQKAAPMLARTPIGHFAQPNDVTEAVLWLASDRSAMINGAEIPVEGGYLIS